MLLRYFDAYKPAITIQQFFTNGFGECKIIVCIDIIQKMRQKHRALANAREKRAPAVKQMEEAEQPPQPRPVYSLISQSYSGSGEMP